MMAWPEGGQREEGPPKRLGERQTALCESKGNPGRQSLTTRARTFSRWRRVDIMSTRRQQRHPHVTWIGLKLLELYAPPCRNASLPECKSYSLRITSNSYILRPMCFQATIYGSDSKASIVDSTSGMCRFGNLAGSQVRSRKAIASLGKHGSYAECSRLRASDSLQFYTNQLWYDRYRNSFSILELEG